MNVWGILHSNTETGRVHFIRLIDTTRFYNQDMSFIIIIIMSCRKHGYPWPSLATSPFCSLPLAGLQGYTPYSPIAAVWMFELVVLLLLVHMWGSIGVHHLWARPCFSSVSCMSGSSNLDSFRDRKLVAVLWGVAARTCSILLATFLCNCRLASSPAVLLASKWCIHTAISTGLLPGRNCVSFYWSGLISIWSIAYW